MLSEVEENIKIFQFLAMFILSELWQLKPTHLLNIFFRNLKDCNTCIHDESLNKFEQ